MFMGCRGTVMAWPTARGCVSREASDPVYLTPTADSAAAKLGLSVGICGRDLRPECSPLTRSRASRLIPLPLAQFTLSLTCAVIWACDTHWMAPVVGSVAQRHGVTEKSCTQPRYR